MSNITSVLYQPGRYVGGDIYEVKQKETEQGHKRVYEPGHKRAGEPMLECYFGLAIPKAPNQSAAALAAMGLPGFKQGWAIKPVFADGRTWDQMYPGVPYWGEVIWLEGHKMFPNLINPQTQRIEQANFAWKVDDGDDTTPKGERQMSNSQREGYPGCWIVNLKSGGMPKVYDESGKPLLDKGLIKRGWWVEVYGSVQGNGQTKKPGVYLNHGMVSYRAPDKEIVFGPDPTKVGFGKFALPAGISSQPIGPATNFPAAGLPGAPAAGFPLPGGLPVQGVAGGIAPAGLPANVHAGLPGSLPGAGAGIVQGLGGVTAGLPGALPVLTSPSNGLPAGVPAQPTAVQQHPGFLQPQVGLPVAGLPVAPVVVGPVLSPALAAQGVTWQQMLAGNWTLESARAAGHVVG